MRTLAFLMLALCSSFTLSESVRAGDDSTARALMTRIAERDEGHRQQAEIRFVLTPQRGAGQKRTALAFREQGDDGRRLALYFESPRSLRGTGFLAWDGAEATQDRWLYLPSLRRARRIPSAERGAYFLGTDLSYDDMRLFGKVDLQDYQFLRAITVEGQPDLWDIEGRPVSEEVAKALGYRRAFWRVDARQLFVLEARLHDLQDALLKTVTFSELDSLDGIVTARRITAINHKTGHRTELQLSNVINDAPFPAERLTPQGLEGGG